MKGNAIIHTSPTIVAKGKAHAVHIDVASRDIKIRQLIREALEMLDKNAPGRAKGLLQEAYAL